MRLDQYEPPESRVLWRVLAGGEQRIAPGRPYWFDNHQRQPAGDVVIQATHRGEIVYRDAQGDRPVGPGQLLLFAYDEATSYGLPQPSDQAYICEWVNLRGAGLLEHITLFRKRHGSVIELGSDRTLLAELTELRGLAGPAGGEQLPAMAAAVHQFVMHLLEHAEQRLSRGLSPVERAVREMLRQTTQPWSLKEWATRFGCSREHLSRVFQQQVGQSPAVYLANARRQRAMTLLTQTDLSLAAVAQQAGYSSVHTLARQIREATGQSPSQVRAGR